jgi:hypothetical protein
MDVAIYLVRNTMRVILSFLIFSFNAALAASTAESKAPVFPSEAPAEIKEAWLRFHELELCQVS